MPAFPTLLPTPGSVNGSAKLNTAGTAADVCTMTITAQNPDGTAFDFTNTATINLFADNGQQPPFNLSVDFDPVTFVASATKLILTLLKTDVVQLAPLAATNCRIAIYVNDSVPNQVLAATGSILLQSAPL
jgi:hypothetical protein